MRAAALKAQRDNKSRGAAFSVKQRKKRKDQGDNREKTKNSHLTVQSQASPSKFTIQRFKTPGLYTAKKGGNVRDQKKTDTVLGQFESGDIVEVEARRSLNFDLGFFSISRDHCFATVNKKRGWVAEYKLNDNPITNPEQTKGETLDQYWLDYRDTDCDALFKPGNFEFGSNHNSTLGSIYYVQGTTNGRMRLTHGSGPAVEKHTDIRETWFSQGKDVPKVTASYPKLKLKLEANDWDQDQKDGADIFEVWRAGDRVKSYHKSRGKVDTSYSPSQQELNVLYQAIERDTFGSTRLKALINSKMDNALKQ